MPDGTLYVCATPIGNLADVTLRVLDTLRAVQLVAAEDTRRTRKLLSYYDIHSPITSLYAHNEAQKTDYVLRRLLDGDSVALVTDAGLPGVSDPGGLLVAQAIKRGVPLTVLPGASAPTTALVASGLVGDGAYRFVGYLPRKRAELEAAVGDWRRCGGVLVAFETPRRLVRSLGWLAALAAQASGAVCRELTKVHEEVVRGSLAELAAHFGDRAAATDPVAELRGEITLVVDFGPATRDAPTIEATAAVQRLIARGLSRRDVASALAVCLGLPRREADALTRAVVERDRG